MAKFKILIGDYEPRSIQKMQEILLQHFDCEIEIASNGLAVFARFNEIKPDLVLLEAMIPKKHGFEVCLDMKNTPHGKNTPVIITTHVYKGVKYKNQAIHIYKCDEYIEKPCPDEVIVDIVKRFIPLSEVKVAAMKTADEKERSSVRAQQTSVETKKAEMPSDIENEIASKVDEVLTLFAGGDLFGPAQKKESEKKQKKEAKAKKPAQESPPVASVYHKVSVPESVPAESVMSSKQTPVETETELNKEIEASVETILKIPFEEKIDQSTQKEKTEELPQQKVKSEQERVPINILPATPVKYKTLNFKMAVIGVSALAFIGVLIVVIPLIIGNSNETKFSAPNAKTDTKKNIIQSAPALPSPIVKPGIRSEQEAGESPAMDLPDTQTDAPITSLSDQEASDKIQEEVQLPKQITVPAAKKDDKKPLPPPATEKKVQEKASAEKAVEPKQVKPSDSTPLSKPASSESTALKQGTQVSPVNAQPKSEPFSPVKESSAVTNNSTSPEKETPASSKALPVVPKQTEPESFAVIKESNIVPSDNTTPKKETRPSQKVLPIVPKQAEPEPAVIVNEGDVIEYSSLDREPGFLAHEMPKYPLMARLRNIEGNVIVKVLIGTNGHIDKVQLVKGVDSSLDDLAMKAAAEWVYRPPTKNGIRVRTWKTETIPFSPTAE